MIMNKITKTLELPYVKGEKVICVNSQVISHYLGELEEGDIYTVNRYDPDVDGLFLEEIKMYNGLPFNAARFKKVKGNSNYPVATENEFTVREIKLTYKKKNLLPVKINGSKSLYDFLLNIWDKNSIGLTEQFVVAYLDHSNSVLSYRIISQGGMNETCVDVRLILSMALKTLCTKIVLAHNHPSGTLNFSDNDFRITRKIETAAKLVDIKIIDHLIISQKGYYSFSDNGYL